MMAFFITVPFTRRDDNIDDGLVSETFTATAFWHRGTTAGTATETSGIIGGATLATTLFATLEIFDGFFKITILLCNL